MKKWLTGPAMLLVVAITATTMVRADDEKVALDKLPKEVTEAIKKKYPDAELVSAEKNKEDGKVVFEVTIKVKKDSIEVTLTPEGKIVTEEKEIDAATVPKVVMEAMEKKYGKSTVKGATVISKDDKVTSYELTIVTKDEKTLEVTFDTEGKFIEEEKVEPKPAPKDKKEDKKDK